MSLKDTKIIDLNLFSGSSELLRQAVGGYYYDSGVGSIEFQSADLSLPIQIETTEAGEIDQRTNLILPRIKYASRIYVDQANSDLVSDDDWKAFIIGGEYADKTYQGIYNNNVYGEHYNTSSLPLLPREVINSSEAFSLSLTTEYFNFYPRFQTSATNKDSELQTPNFYLLDSASFLIPQRNAEIVQSRYQYTEIKNFLTNSYVNSTIAENTELENLFVLNPKLLTVNNGLRLDTEDLLAHGGFDDDFSSLYSLMPYGNKIYIDEDLAGQSGQTDFRDIIDEHNFQVKFIKLLKEVFQGESSLQTSTVNFAVNTDANLSTGTATGSIQSTNTIPVRLVDAPTMLLYSYRNPTSETDNIALLTGSEDYSEQKDYAFDTTGIYRYENTSVSLGVLNDFVQKIKNKFLHEPVTYNLENFLDQANNSKYYETVAFRVEKIGGAPTGDSNTENTIQNIWFYNTDEQIKYFDTQVKYDTDYTYKIYKYDIVQGYKYQLSDVVTTRQIATEGEDTNKVYCLEFYDPSSGQTSNQLFSDENLRTQFEQSSSLELERQNLLNTVNTMIDDVRTAYMSTISSLSTSSAAPGADSPQEVFNKFFLTGLNPINTKTVRNLYILLDYDAEEGYSFLGNRSIADYETLLSEVQAAIDSRGSRGTTTYATITPSGGGATSATAPSSGGGGTFTYSSGRFSSGITTGTASPSSGSPSSSPSPSPSVAVLDQTLLVLENMLMQVIPLMNGLVDKIDELNDKIVELSAFGDNLNLLATNAQINSSYPYLADFNITIEPSLKIIEIPLEEKRMRIVDHPPNDFVINPHHLLDQSNRLAFYCKYDTFSMNTVSYPPILTTQDEENRDAYLEGHDFISISELTQESVSRPRFIEVYRTTTKPTSYTDFAGNIRKTIDLRQPNGDIYTDHLFTEVVRENIKYYYTFRALSENGIAGQMSPVFEAELINDGGYVYGKFEQYSEEDLAVPTSKEPLLGFKKLFNIVPNIQHLQLDTSAATFASSSVSQMSNIALGTDAEDDLWDSDKYYKIRLTSKKTGKKLDLNIAFNKKERK